jgi:hypothetical protein
MSAAYIEGTRVPVTWVKAGPCVVTQVKKLDKDGYWAVQLGFGSKKRRLKRHPKRDVKDNQGVGMSAITLSTMGILYQTCNNFANGDIYLLYIQNTPFMMIHARIPYKLIHARYSVFPPFSPTIGDSTTP